MTPQKDVTMWEDDQESTRRNPQWIERGELLQRVLNPKRLLLEKKENEEEEEEEEKR